MAPSPGYIGLADFDFLILNVSQFAYILRIDSFNSLGLFGTSQGSGGRLSDLQNSTN